MKTDLVEIFQSIRANVQPYTANGFTARINSETAFEIWNEKLFNDNGEKMEAVCFASLSIEIDFVKLCISSLQDEIALRTAINQSLLNLATDDFCFKIDKLDDTLLDEISVALSIAFTHFKQKGWA